MAAVWSPDGRIAGWCIRRGTEGVTDWLELGRAEPETGTFRAVGPDGVHVPERRTSLADAASRRR